MIILMLSSLWSALFEYASCYMTMDKYWIIADNSGKVRIWDTTQKEHVLKNEFQPLGGPIKDLAWSGDSQRIVVVGEGREK